MAIDLRAFTPARVALGRTGHSVPTRELLRFELDHARARDAVYEEVDPTSISYDHIVVRSQAVDRATYLRRPDLGRRLSDNSRSALASYVRTPSRNSPGPASDAAPPTVTGAPAAARDGKLGASIARQGTPAPYDAAIVIADGLSARAIHRHAAPLLTAFLPRLEGWRLAPLIIALQARVAIGDDIGEALGAEVVVVLIGERPGLTSPDSLGVYLTWDPRIGRTDAERNCISNIRTEGLSYRAAAGTLYFLMHESRVRKLSGVALKDDARIPQTSDSSLPPNSSY